MIAPSTNLFVRDRFTWLAYLMLAYYAYAQATLGPLMPFLRTELDLNYTVAGLHISAFALGMILAGLLGDRWAQRRGRRFVFWAGGAGMAVGALILAVSHHVTLTILGALVMGWLGSFLLVMIQATLSDRHGEQRAIALTESNVAASICAALAPVFIGTFQRLDLGWRSALYLVAAAFVLLFLYFQPEPIPASRATGRDTRLSGRQSLPFFFWGYWTVVLLGVSIEWCMIFWGADFLENSVGLSKVNAATMMGLFFGAMVIGRIAGSRLSRTIPSPTLLLAALGIVVIGFPLYWLATAPALNLLGLFIAGLGVANLFPLTMSVAVGVAADQANAASARVALAGGLAILISPFILGWVADQLDIQNAYGVVALLLIVAVAVTWLTNRQVAVNDPAYQQPGFLEGEQG
jgi:predicted MFS family arabinose efflux permease